MRENGVISSSGAPDAEQLIALIRAQQPVSAEVLLRLLADRFPASLPEAQRLAHIHNQLRHLVDVGQVRNQGSRRYPAWGLAAGRDV